MNLCSLIDIFVAGFRALWHFVRNWGYVLVLLLDDKVEHVFLKVSSRLNWRCLRALPHIDPSGGTGRMAIIRSVLRQLALLHELAVVVLVGLRMSCFACVRPICWRCTWHLWLRVLTSHTVLLSSMKFVGFNSFDPDYSKSIIIQL